MYHQSTSPPVHHLYSFHPWDEDDALSSNAPDDTCYASINDQRDCHRVMASRPNLTIGGLRRTLWLHTEGHTLLLLLYFSFYTYKRKEEMEREKKYKEKGPNKNYPTDRLVGRPYLSWVLRLSYIYVISLPLLILNGNVQSKTTKLPPPLLPSLLTATANKKNKRRHLTFSFLFLYF